MSVSRRKFTTEYKVQAAHRVIDSGRTVTEVAHELGLVEVTLGNRVRAKRSGMQAVEESDGQVLHRPVELTISWSLYLVRKVMKLAGFFGLPKKRRYPKRNYSPEIENLIKGNFQSTTPHEKWFIDITQKRYLSGTIDLAAIKDAATRMVVGYATGRGPNSELVVRALSMATSQYKTKDTIIHSDMWSVFKLEHYRNAVKQAGLVQSMGNAGLSFANQVIESFFGKIKTELLHTRTWKSYDEIQKVIAHYCESFYNSIRPQMVLRGRTPLEEFHRLTSCLNTKATANFA